jgi:hypothetical protein
MLMTECPCGSGLMRREIRDANGMFITCVCSWCEEEKLRGYRHEIFIDLDASYDDLIDEDD